MSLLTATGATASVAQGATAVTIAGLDIATVQPGMSLHFGSQTTVTAPGYIIATVTPQGVSGGTLTLQSPVPSAQTGVPFVVDTRGFAGGGASLAIASFARVMNRLTALFGAGTIYDTGSRVVSLLRGATTDLAAMVFGVGAREDFRLEARAIGGVEHLCVRRYAAGTWVDVVTIPIGGGYVKIGDGENAPGMAAEPLLRVQGKSAGTGILARRDGFPEVGMRSGGDYGIGTFTSHDVRILRNGFTVAVFDESGLQGYARLTALQAYAPLPTPSTVQNIASGAGVPLVLPAGGTWFYHAAIVAASGGGVAGNVTGVGAGGATVGASFSGFEYRGFTWKIVS